MPRARTLVLTAMLATGSTPLVALQPARRGALRAAVARLEGSAPS